MTFPPRRARGLPEGSRTVRGPGTSVRRRERAEAAGLRPRRYGGRGRARRMQIAGPGRGRERGARARTRGRGAGPGREGTRAHCGARPVLGPSLAVDGLPRLALSRRRPAGTRPQRARRPGARRPACRADGGLGDKSVSDSAGSAHLSRPSRATLVLSRAAGTTRPRPSAGARAG